MHAINPLWIPIIGILMPIVLVPIIIILKQRSLRREWEHKERMKAMEMGVAPPPAGGGVLAIGAGVPIASVIAAAVTSLAHELSSARDEEVPIFAIAWGIAFMISVLGMVSGLILARMEGRARKESESLYAMGHGKPSFDPDAYDVVSSRS
jgi:hypothetical protein